jgi:hypothetical protein
MKVLHHLFYTGAVIAMLLQACRDKDSLLNIGKLNELAEKTISTSGGVIEIAEGSLRGFKIEVPEGSYADETKFMVAYAEITSHNFGDDFKLLSPLIRVENGGAYSAGMMTVTVPVNVPEGRFAMPFIYKDGYLEGLPIVSADNKQVTFLTRHFTDLVVGLPAADEQYWYSNYETDFNPGVDDWHLGNPKTYNFNNGQCSGESISMIWYFNEMKKHGKPLHGQFGIADPPDFWKDDVLAVKLCAAVQDDDYDHRFGNAVLEKYKQGQMGLSDERTLAQFAAAFKANEKAGTKKPQFLMISNPARDAHAVVIYAMRDGSLYVADPNHPGDKDRKIVFNKHSRKFEEYTSRGIVYNNFVYMGESALVSFGQVKEQWRNFEKGTVGSDLFPPYTLNTRDENGDLVQIKDRVLLPSDGRLRLNIQSSSGEALMPVFYDARGKHLESDELSVTIPPGTTRIGVEIQIAGMWVGFTWINVQSTEEQKQNVDPEKGSGKMQMTVSVNGSAVRVDSAIFDAGDAISLQGFGPGPAGDFWTERWLKVHAGPFRGVGTYTLDQNGVGTSLWEVREGSFELNTRSPGNLVIEQWSAGKISGRFSFEAVDGQGRVKVVEGRFSN